MLRGMATATSQLLAQSLRLEVLSANLAHVETPGYRQDQIGEQAFAQLLVDRLAEDANTIGALDIGVVMSRPTVDLSAGPIEQTERPLDVAILGDGFFVVQSPDGERYTRRGTFRQDEAGQLVSIEGWPVLGENGPIAADQPLRILPSGEVWAGDAAVGRLQVVTFPAETEFLRHGGTYLSPVDGAPQPVDGAEFLPGHLEGSNVDLTMTMTELLGAARSYQAAQRALIAENDALTRLIQQTSQQV